MSIKQSVRYLFLILCFGGLFLNANSIPILGASSAVPPNDPNKPAIAPAEPKPSSPPPLPDPDANKYFHEPGGDDLMHHYDIRYYKEIVSEQTRKRTLTALIRGYLSSFQELGLETWIAHGTLLGWYWSGTILPWDWDIDVQVSERTLAVMAKHYNHSFHDYHGETEDAPKRFLLDVNPWQWERVPGDGANIIDARFIDTWTGLFVDITGLSEVQPDTHPGVWQCKHEHKYNVTDLFPLRDTTFEGVPAKVPYSYAPMLAEEYSDMALIRTEFQGHRWNQEAQEWLKIPEREKKKESPADDKAYS